MIDRLIPPQRRPAAQVRPIAAWALGGTLVRIAYTLGPGRDIDPGFTDAAFYSAAANLMADGEGYVDVFRSLQDGALAHTAHHPPGWPALLSLASLAGVDTVLGHRLVGAVLGGVVVVAVGLLARRIAGPTAGVVAAAGAALHPTLVAADASLMTETLGGLLVLLALLGAQRAVAAPTALRGLAVGVVIGMAALTRSEALLLVPLIGLAVVVAAARRADGGWRAGVRLGATIVIGTVVVVAPWTARNTALLDEPVLVSTNDATVLAGANCDVVYQGSGLGSWSYDCARQAGMTEGGEAAEAAAARRVAFDHVRSNLDRLPVVVPVRVLRTWALWSPFDPPAEGRHVGTQQFGTIIWLVVLLPAAIIGAGVLVRRRERFALALLLAPVVAATAASAVGTGMLRLRHPIELSALVLAGVAVDAYVRRRTLADPSPAVTGP